MPIGATRALAENGGLRETDNNAGMIYLSNDIIEITVLPPAGGNPCDGAGLRSYQNCLWSASVAFST